MTAATHFIVGAAIVNGIRNPYLSLPIAFLSHFVIDVIPHHQLRKYNPWQHLRGEMRKVWDFSWPLGVQMLALAHLILLLIIVLLTYQGKMTALVFTGGLLAISPDAYEWSRFSLGIPEKLPTVHFLHNEKSESWDSIWGILIQVTVFVAAMYWLMM